jgi:hypothetical protein
MEVAVPTNRKQKKMRTYRDRALDTNEPPGRRLRAARALVELAGFTQRSCPIARRVANEFFVPDMPDDIRRAAIKLLDDVNVGEAHTKNALLAKIKIGDTVYQNGFAYRVTEIKKGLVTAAEPINVNAGFQSN